MREVNQVGPEQKGVPRVSQTTNPGKEAPPDNWSWVETTVWTERMLAALVNGVKGGKSNRFFAELGLFTMKEARSLASQSR